MFGRIVRFWFGGVVVLAVLRVALFGEYLKVEIDAEAATLGHENLEGFFYTLEEWHWGEEANALLEVQLGGSGDGQFEVAAFGADPAFYRIGRVSMDLPQSGGTQFIVDRPAFEYFAQRSDFPGALQAREVKFVVVDVDTNSPRLYFINTANVQYHYDFVSGVLGVPVSLRTFNLQTYFTSNKRYIAGSLVAHDHFIGESGEQGIYTMEFWPTDPVAFEYVSLAYDLLTKGMPFAAGKTYYHAPSETQRNLYQEELLLYEESEVKVVPTEDLFENVTFVPMNVGVSYGRLVLAEGASQLSVRDIVIFDTIPNTLSHVAGIITELPQTPLSHINLKAKQNGTPNAYVRDFSESAEVQALLGRNVRLEVSVDGVSIEPATQAEVDEYLENVRPSEEQFPVRNLSVETIRDLSDLGFGNADSIGAKAANVAELQNVLPSGMVPDGYAVPFYFYDEFMKLNGFYDVARSMMEGEGFATDPEARDDALAVFRDKIRDEGVLPQWMLDALQVMYDSFPEGRSLRCRSSTNNEDLPGFNGAGLYNSYTHHPDEGHISKSMKQVWASLWTYRAFEEREFYRIDHFTTAMGVLVHPNFSDEQVNGVAVTKNIFDVNWQGYYVNAQIGEDLVTNPDEESVPEEFLVANLAGAERYEIQYVRNSNQVDVGEKVLTKDQVFELADRMADIQNHFRVLYESLDEAFAMEIEFKITEAGDLSIKQARPWVE